MKTLFESDVTAEVRRRLALLRPDSQRLWGKMDAAQMAAHCSVGIEMALGEVKPPRALIGRLIGWAVKPMVVAGDEPMRRNSPTAQELVVANPRDLDAERARLAALIERFRADGPKGCTTHPHPFFGSLTPPEWAALMYKHLDHSASSVYRP